MNPPAKITYPTRSAFYDDVQRRVHADFRGRTDRRAHWLPQVKSLCFLLAMAGCYATILSGHFGRLGTLLLAVFFGFVTVCFVFNTAHDASHGTFSSSPRLNRLAAYAWNLVGISSYTWDLKHNVTHHVFTNVVHVDRDISGGGALRLHPDDPWLWFHRYQHIYAVPLYSFISLITIYVQDLEWMTRGRWGNKDISRHPPRAWIEFVLTKAFYVTYSLVIPLWVLPFPWWQVLLGYLAMHVVIGQIMTFILMTVHVFEGADFVRPDEEGDLPRGWAVHQLATTMDVAPRSRLVNFLVGGLNTHVVHHLFPKISHAHTYRLTDIVRETAREHGVVYHEYGLVESMCTHLRALRRLGVGEGGALPSNEDDTGELDEATPGARGSRTRPSSI